MKMEIHKGDWVVYAGHIYEVADDSGPTHVGIYDEPPSKHVDYLNRSGVKLATVEEIQNAWDKEAYLAR